MYLLDTNIFLEVILSREYSKVIQDFLNRDITTALFVSDFSVFSVGIFLVRRNLSDKFVMKILKSSDDRPDKWKLSLENEIFMTKS